MQRASASNAGSAAGAHTLPVSHVATTGGVVGAQRWVRPPDVTGGTTCVATGAHVPPEGAGASSVKCDPPPLQSPPTFSGVQPVPRVCGGTPQLWLHIPSLKYAATGGAHAFSGGPHEHVHTAEGAVMEANPV
jgi:hypothetical protein